MAVNLERGMGLQGGAPREMRFFLSYRMMSPYYTRRADQLTALRFDTQMCEYEQQLSNGELWYATFSN